MAEFNQTTLTESDSTNSENPSTCLDEALPQDVTAEQEFLYGQRLREKLEQNTEKQAIMKLDIAAMKVEQAYYKKQIAAEENTKRK